MSCNHADHRNQGDLYPEQPASIPAPEKPSSRPPQPRSDDRAPETDDHWNAGLLGRHTELVFALLSGVALVAGWLIARSGGGMALPLFIAAYFFGGYFTLREAIDNLRARRFKIDTLMLVAAAGAAALGSWAEGSLLLFLFSLGHALEEFAMGRARREIEALAKLAPETASIRSGGAIKHVPVEALEVGDIVVVKPNERLPADGVVIAGASSVN